MLLSLSLAQNTTICEDALQQGYLLGKEEYLFRSSTLTTRYTPNKGQLDYWQRHVVALKKYRDITLIVAPLPRRGMFEQDYFQDHTIFEYDSEGFFEDYKDILVFFKNAGADSFSLLPSAQTSVNAGTSVFFKTDHHLTSEFMRTAIQDLSNYIKSNYSNTYLLQQAQFHELREEGIYEFTGSLSRIVMEACNTIYPSESYTYVTAEAVQVDLLEELIPPQYFLICNSNCERAGTPYRDRDPDEYQSGAPEFLRLALQRSVLDHGVSGSGLASYESMLYNLLPKSQLGPKFILFLPAIYETKLPKHLLRQLTPAVTGFDSDALVELSRDITANRFDLLSAELEAFSASGNDYYVSLLFSDLSINTFTLELEYASGEVESINVARKGRILNPGVWHIELADRKDIKGILSRVSIVLAEDYDQQTSVEVSLRKLP